MSQSRRPTPNGADHVYAEVAEMVHLCIEAGHQPNVDALAAQYPELADEIRQLVPLVTTLHQLRHDPEPVPRPAPASRRSLRPLGRIGDYRILREIASGGMGVVYEAQHLLTSQRVALKVLPFQQALDPRHVKRFKIGGYVARQLNHRNIVPVFEVGRKRGVYYQVMRYIDGPSLAAVIEELRERLGAEVGAPKRYSEASRVLAESLQNHREGPRAASSLADTDDHRAHPSDGDGMLGDQAYFRTVAHLGLQAAEALEYLHSLDHVHRDVKPANLLWEGGRLWLTDFGLVMRPGRRELTGPGELVGTLRYMSPEQVLGQKDLVNRRTDIYGLGVTLYELLTLEPAFGEQDSDRLKRQIIRGLRRRPRWWNRAIPEGLEAIVVQAMAQDPNDRYATAQELADDLRSFLEGRPVCARRHTARQRAQKWIRRRWGWLVAVALVGLAAAGGSWGYQHHQLARQRQRTEVIDAYVAESVRNEIDYACLRARAVYRPSQPREETLRRIEQIVHGCAQFDAAEVSAHSGLKRALAVNFLYVALRHRVFGEDAPALEYCLQARDLLMDLSREPYRRPEYLALLAASHNELGLLYSRLGQHQAAEQALGQARAYLEPRVAELRETPRNDRHNAKFQRDFTLYGSELAASLLELGNLRRQAGRVKEAEFPYREAVSLFQELAEQITASAEFQYDLAGALNNLGLALAASGRPQDANEQHVIARDVLTRLVKAVPGRADYLSRLGATHVQLALLHRQPSQRGEFAALLDRALQHHRAAFELRPDEPDYRTFLSGTLLELAGTEIRLGRHARAASLAGEIAERFADDWQEIYRSAVILAYCVDVADRDSSLPAAERRRRADEYTQRIRVHLAELATRGKDDAAIQNEVAWFLATCPVAPLRIPAEAVALARKAVDRDSQVAAYWHTLGVANYRAGSWKAALEALERSASLREKETGTDWLFLAMTHWQLGNDEPARMYHARAVRWMTEHKPDKEDLRRFYAEAEVLLKGNRQGASR